MQDWCQEYLWPRIQSPPYLKFLSNFYTIWGRRPISSLLLYNYRENLESPRKINSIYNFIWHIDSWIFRGARSSMKMR
ncbi:Acyl-coenzyme A oxidase [Dirofilaria immitis]